MRRWMAASLLFALIVAFCSSIDAPKVQAQAKAVPPEEETFMTADGIQLHGLFHKSAKNPGSDPVVILIYPPGKDNSMTKGDWIGLANRLTNEGYNVFRFDWRGHGKSNDIKDAVKFWTNEFTGVQNQRSIKGANQKPIKDTFRYADFKDAASAISYMPVYVTDLAAVRAHLDSKNDAGEVNTSSIFLIGSEGAATIGLGWMATEWNRPQFAPTPNQLLPIDPKYKFVPQQLRDRDYETAGNDISGAVWLSAARPSSISKQSILGLVSGILPNGQRMPLAPKIRDNNPMLFVYASGDKNAENGAKMFHNEALVGAGNKGIGLRPLNDKYLMPIEKADKNVGVMLLGDNEKLKTEDNIVKFMSTIQQERKGIVRRNRSYTSPYFIKLDAFGLVASQP